jgi:predicted transcriptional regulator
MELTPYQSLAERLNALPDGFPPTEDGAELRLLQFLYTPEEAQLAAQLRLTKETSNEIASRLELDHKTIRDLLKKMSRKGLIAAGKVSGGIGFGLEPFVVGIYEHQAGRIDKELAELFEDYYQQAFGTVVDIKPQFHRVIPVDETVDVDMEVLPFESITSLIDQAKAWGVLDCICRKQKALIGEVWRFAWCSMIALTRSMGTPSFALWIAKGRMPSCVRHPTRVLCIQSAINRTGIRISVIAVRAPAESCAVWLIWGWRMSSPVRLSSPRLTRTFVRSAKSVRITANSTRSPIRRLPSSMGIAVWAAACARFTALMKR